MDRELQDTDGWAVVSRPPSNPGTLHTRALARGFGNGTAATLEHVDHRHMYGYRIEEGPRTGYEVVFFKRPIVNGLPMTMR